MTKITIDVEEIKKNLKARAVLARGQIEALAKRAQKDLSEKEIRKKIEEVLDRVKAQDFVKNKTFSGIVDRLVEASGQASRVVGQVRARVNTKKQPVRAKKKAAASKVEVEAEAPKA